MSHKTITTITLGALGAASFLLAAHTDSWTILVLSMAVYAVTAIPCAFNVFDWAERRFDQLVYWLADLLDITDEAPETSTR